MLRFVTPATIKITGLLFVFLLIDFMRPFYFALQTELLFVGILWISLHFKLAYCLVLCALFGILKDSFSGTFFLFHTSLFIFLTVTVHYLRTQFHLTVYLKTALIVISTLGYALLNSLSVETFSFFTVFSFSFQSWLLFYLSERFLLLWIRDSSPARSSSVF